MSLLHRWSLPSRGFMRSDKSQDDDEPAPSRLSNTVHNGQHGPHRRPTISAAFSALFDRTENRWNSSQGADDWPLLGRRNENIRPETGSKYSLAHGYDDTSSAEVNVSSSPGRDSKHGSNPKSTGKEPLKQLLPATLSRVRKRIEEMPRIRSLSLSSGETSGTEKRGDGCFSFPTRSTSGLERIRSISSSYPSEGMRSPVAMCRSPELAMPGNNDLTKYLRYGKYPSRSSWHLSSMPVSEANVSVPIGLRQLRAALDPSDISRSTAVGPNSSFDPSPFRDPVEYHRTESRYSNVVIGPRRGSGIIRKMDRKKHQSSNSELIVPILENENAVSSQLDVRFLLYKRPNARSTSDDDQLRCSSVGSADELCGISVDTNETSQTAVRHSAFSERDDDWSTIHDSGVRPLSRRSSWMQLFTLKNADGSTRTLTQQFHRVKFRKWVRKVCFKTKARFALVGRPVSSVGFRGAKTTRHIWRRKNNNKRKVSKLKRNLGVRNRSNWSVGKMLDSNDKEGRKKLTMADKFWGTTLATKKSLQLRFGRTGKERGRDGEMEGEGLVIQRVRSCPADLGL
ncbi:hypothetical protein GGR50DRAFT_115840 [Xylaria sp. CBS 124048]|nr:hypothetical protein GGR50DRAFT_115840 [Xylaria sp. CBS 124048]